MLFRSLTYLGLAAGLALVAAAGCGDDESTGTGGSGGAGASGGSGGSGGGDTGGGGSGGCSVPATWSAPDWTANTAEALALRAQLDALAVTTMRDAEEGTAVTVNDLTSLMMAGDPSLNDTASPGFLPVVNAAFTEFVDAVAAGPSDLVDGNGNWAPGDEGGVFGTDSRGIHEGGIEIRQIVDKGLFAGGGLYHHAVGLTAGAIEPATIDAIAALFGADSALNPDEVTDSANYAHQMGYFGEISGLLIAAKAHAGDPACSAERDQALTDLFRTWEEAMVARFVYYANAAAGIIETAANDDDYAGAFHQLSEGLGLVGGFHGLPNPNAGPLSGGAKVLGDADIEAMLTALGVDLADLASSTTGTIVVDATAFRAAVDAVEANVATALGLSLADVQAWRTPSEG